MPTHGVKATSLAAQGLANSIPENFYDSSGLLSVLCAHGFFPDWSAILCVNTLWERLSVGKMLDKIRLGVPEALRDREPNPCPATAPPLPATPGVCPRQGLITDWVPTGPLGHT